MYLDLIFFAKDTQEIRNVMDFKAEQLVLELSQKVITTGGKILLKRPNNKLYAIILLGVCTQLGCRIDASHRK